MPSFSFWIFAILDSFQKKQQHLLGSGSKWTNFGGLKVITLLNNVEFSWNFDCEQSLKLYTCHLKHIEKLNFYRDRMLPNFESLVQLWPQFTSWRWWKSKNRHRSIQINQNEIPKTIITRCFFYAFFGYKLAQAQKSRGHSLG